MCEKLIGEVRYLAIATMYQNGSHTCCGDLAVEVVDPVDWGVAVLKQHCRIQLRTAAGVHTDIEHGASCCLGSWTTCFKCQDMHETGEADTGCIHTGHNPQLHDLANRIHIQSTTFLHTA